MEGFFIGANRLIKRTYSDSKLSLLADIIEMLLASGYENMVIEV